jgi:hypothetical protein
MRVPLAILVLILAACIPAKPALLGEEFICEGIPRCKPAISAVMSRTDSDAQSIRWHTEAPPPEGQIRTTSGLMKLFAYAVVQSADGEHLLKVMCGVDRCEAHYIY